MIIVQNKRVIHRILLSFLVPFFFVLNSYSTDAPKIENGILDLDEWDFESQDVLRLRGQWEFYWQELLTPIDFSVQFIPKKEFLEVPGTWNKRNKNEAGRAGFGYATYRINLKNAKPDQLYSLKLGRIYGAYRLWINNDLMAEVGIVGDSRDSFFPLWRPVELVFLADRNEIVILIQVSNFDQNRGGILDDIVIGKPNQVSEYNKRKMSLDVFTFGMLLIMTIYLMGIFITRINDLIPLFFSLACLMSLVFVLVNGELLITRVFPDITWHITMKIDFITNYLTATFFSLFFALLFKDYISKYFLWFMAIWGGVMSLFVLLSPVRVFTTTLASFEIVVVLVFSYVIARLIKAALDGNRQALFSLLGTLILLLSAVNDMLYNGHIIKTTHLFPFGVFFFVFFHSILLSRRFYNLLVSVEKLSKRLLTANIIKSALLEDTSRTFKIPLRVLVENLGAEKGFILVERNSIWYVGIGASVNNPDINAMLFLPIEKIDKKDSNSHFSRSIVDRVITSRETIILNNSMEQGSFKDDPNIGDEKPKSIYCTPLLHKDILKGVLYLENNTSYDVFNADRIELIDMHTFQIAILLDNIEIYHELEKLNRTLERKVKQRTCEIENQRDEIESQKDEILAQRDLLNEQMNQIEQHNKSVTDSIKYASRIQNAILPSEDLVKYFFPKHFILYEPRDIVSGDFYWIGQRNNKIIVAVIDCTGHGVPGAFMSVLGFSLLNEVINKTDTLQANEILNELRDKVIISLGQTGSRSETKDGMALALCIFETGSMKIQFAGAENSLIIFRDSKWMEYKGDRMPVGIDERAGKSFTNHEIELKKGDALYMMTDGYSDQFGGPNNKRFGNTQFKELLLSVQEKIMFEQRSILEKKINDWRGETDKIDDILVMGIKV